MERDRKKVMDAASSSDYPALKRCIVRPPKFHLVDEACSKWFSQQRSKGAPVSGVLLHEKAIVFR